MNQSMIKFLEEYAEVVDVINDPETTLERKLYMIEFLQLVIENFIALPIHTPESFKAALGVYRTLAEKSCEMRRIDDVGPK